MSLRRLKSLMWREVFLWKKYIAINTAIITFLVVMAFLVTGSMHYGNLANVGGTAESVEELKGTIFLFLFFYPTCQMMAYIMSIVESTTVRDELLSWKRFRKTTPVKPIEFTTARYLLNVLIYAGGILLAMLYALVYCKVFDMQFTLSIFAVIMVMSAGVLIFAVCIQMLVMLLHSLEKAMIVFMVIFMAGFSCYIISTADQAAAFTKVQDMIAGIEEKCLNWLPWLALVVPVTFLLGFAGMTFLLGRREK